MLGLLPDEATERLDEASIADDEVAARLHSVETDLVDSYVRGQLVGRTLDRFESYYLMSPRRRESVRVATRFVRALDRAVPRDEGLAWKDRIARPTSVASLVAAAALVLVVSGILLFQAERPRNPMTVATSEGGAVGNRAQAGEQQPTGERGAVPPDGLERDRPSAAASATTPASEPLDGKRAAPPGQIVAVVLLPPTRAVAPIPTLAIPSDADRIGFELRLESNDFSRYQVGLKNPATNNILWRSDWIPARVVRRPGLSLCRRSREPARATALCARTHRPGHRRSPGGHGELHRSYRGTMIRTARVSGTFIALAVLSVELSSTAAEPRQQEAAAIDSGAAIERSVAIGEEHRYRLTLAAGECAAVVVEQRGIDVVVRASRDGETDVVEFQEEVRRTGQEEVHVVANEAGVYTLAIAPSRGIYSGTYAVRLVTRRAATDSDRSMYEARRLRSRGLDLAKAAMFVEAQRTFDQAIAITEAVGGPDDVFVGMLLYDLVTGVLEMREFTRAESLQRRALTIFDKSWGEGPSVFSDVADAARSGAAAGRAASPSGSVARVRDAAR